MAVDYLNYVLSNPDLRENVEALGLTNTEMKEWGKWHWDSYGQNEDRENTVTNISNLEGYTQSLGAEHYQGRDVRDVLQGSVRSAYGGDFDESMWTARENIDNLWNLRNFSADQWNLDPDNPYKRGILGDNISVEAGVGQLYNPIDDRFIQDRYNTGYQASDFPAGWVTDNKWTGPSELRGYWDALTTAERDPDTGDLTTTIPRPTEGWEMDPLTVTGKGDRTRAGVASDAQGAMDLSAYRPWTQNYWDQYVPEASQGLLKMGSPQRDYGLAYLPGEMRDPVSWAAGSGGGGVGHIPRGIWASSPESYTVQTNLATGQPYAVDARPRAPWRFTTGPAQASNIYNTPWTARSMNLNNAQGADWANFLSSVDTSPTIKPGLLAKTVNF